MITLFADIKLTLDTPWESVTLQRLEEEFGITLERGEIAQDLEIADVSPSRLMLRYSWKMQTLTFCDIMMFVFEADGEGPGVISRHYRLRCVEKF